MFLFLRLVLAHLVGDTVFQPDEVYELKKSGLHGVILHAVVLFLSLILFSLPYLHHSALWIILIFAAVTHVVQDEIKLRYRFSKKLNFPFFVADQIIHVLFLCPVLFLKSAYYPVTPDIGFHQFYNSNSLIIIAIGYVISVFLGAYLWEAFKISYFKNPVLSNAFSIKYGMFERFVITTAVVFSLWFLALIPVLRILMRKKLYLWWDLVFNIVISLLIGLFLRNFVFLYTMMAAAGTSPIADIPEKLYPAVLTRIAHEVL